jgi:hypothetical protein
MKAALVLKTPPNDLTHYLLEIGDSSTDLDCGFGIHCLDRPPTISGF